jgi:hypothetical protein
VSHSLQQQRAGKAAERWRWLDAVTAEGWLKKSGKAHNWKANYHDVRAMVKFIEAFSGIPTRTEAATKPGLATQLTDDG